LLRGFTLGRLGPNMYWFMVYSKAFPTVEVIAFVVFPAIMGLVINAVHHGNPLEQKVCSPS